jgi:hypothetical protein
MMNVHYAPKLCLPRNAVFGGIFILTAGLLAPAATAQDNSRGAGGHTDHIFYIMMENHSTSEIWGTWTWPMPRSPTSLPGDIV